MQIIRRSREVSASTFALAVTALCLALVSYLVP